MSRQDSLYTWEQRRGAQWAEHLERLEQMLAPVDAPLFEALALAPPHHIADIGCGGGGTTCSLAALLPEGSVVEGYDVSSVLVEAARQRHDALRFEVADVSQVCPAPRGYDRLMSRFGVMFFEDPASAFSNLRGWLKPDGRFAFAVWGPKAQNLWFELPRQVLSAFVELPEPSEDRPGPFRYAAPQGLGELLECAGFESLEMRRWRGGLKLGGGLGAAEAASFALQAFSVLRAGMERLDEGQAQLAHAALARELRPHEVEDKVELEAEVLIWSGGCSE